MPQVAVQPRRASWVIAIVVAIAAVVATAAISIASSPSTDEIVLNLDGRSGSFSYGFEEQDISTTSSPCRLSDSSLNGPIVEIDASTYSWRGDRIPGYAGLKDGNMGVNKAGGGNSHWCQKIDYLKYGRSEELTLTLGELPLSEGKLISSADLRFRVWSYAKAKVEFLRDGAVIGENIFVLDPHDDDDDHEYTIGVQASADGALFDGIRISMKKGSAGLTNNSVLILEGTEADIAIDAATNGDATGTPFIEVGAENNVTWTYLVTNTGDQDITSFTVEDSEHGSIGCPVTSLASGESTTCTATGTAAAGAYSNSATVTGTGEYGDEVSATDTSGYFGSLPAIQVTATINGDDGLYIPAGNPITFTYLVENLGNVELTGVIVNDSILGDRSCPMSVAAGGSFTCTVDGIAEESAPGIFYMNTATATGTPPVGADVEDMDDSSYFGFVSSYTYELTNNGPVVVEGDPVIWTFTLTNTGNVPIPDATLLQANVEGTPISCTVDPLGVGETDSCMVTLPTAAEGEQTVEFVIITTDPNGEQNQTDPIESTYYGGLACLESTLEGGSGLFDTAQTGLFIGPDSKAGSEDCAVAVEITAEVEDDGDQAVTIEPPAGEEYSWGNTTGVVTITWDAEDAGPGPVLRTLQVLSDDSEVVIPWCLEVIPVTPGEFGYELLDDEGVYGAAVGAGDVCLILQNTETVTDGEGVYTQTTEAFYLYNDPRFVRK